MVSAVWPLAERVYFIEMSADVRLSKQSWSRDVKRLNVASVRTILVSLHTSTLLPWRYSLYILISSLNNVSFHVEIHPDGRPQQTVPDHPGRPASSQRHHPHHRPADHKHAFWQAFTWRTGEFKGHFTRYCTENSLKTQTHTHTKHF